MVTITGPGYATPGAAWKPFGEMLEKVVKRRNVECPDQMEKGTPDGCSVPCSTGRPPPTLHLQRVRAPCRYDLPLRRLLIFYVTFYYLIHNKKATRLKLTRWEPGTGNLLLAAEHDN